jgi:serine/threonine protein kinase
MFNKLFNKPTALKAPATPVAGPVPVTATNEKFGDVYVLGPVLGKGAFSTVHLATRRKDGMRFATKVVSRRKLPPVDEKALRDEAEVLIKLSHPHIVRIVGWFEEKDAFYVPLELCEGGELFDRIVQKSCYTEREARDLVSALLNHHPASA